MSEDSVNDCSMFKIFRQEVDTHLSALQEGLLNWENNFPDEALVKDLIRAADSMKGAAGILGMDNAKHLAHAMEDFLCLCKKKKQSPRAKILICYLPRWICS